MTICEPVLPSNIQLSKEMFYNGPVVMARQGTWNNAMLVIVLVINMAERGDQERVAAELRTEVDAICSVQQQCAHWASIVTMLVDDSRRFAMLLYASCDKTLMDVIDSDVPLSWPQKHRIVQELAEALAAVVKLVKIGAQWLKLKSWSPILPDMIFIHDGHVKLAPELRTVRELVEHAERQSDAMPNFARLLGAAPGQMSHAPADEAAVVYSFGTVAWQVATQNYSPFPNESPGKALRKILNERLRVDLPIVGAPDVLNFVIDVSTQYEPENRPSFNQICRWLAWRQVVCTVGFGLHSLELPALVMLAIVDEFEASELVPMHSKWNAICAIKHFQRS